MRAFLKATDICAAQPERAARYMADKGYAPSYTVALETIGELPYRRWRDANPEDTLRFHALRLHEAGIIRINPQRLIAQGTDWRFFNELRKELKA
jgi:NitT/TauT family transport system substrate-binding protein